jgi:aminoacrylate hydrolase
VDRAAVWGESAGCAIGLVLALTFPERVSALVLSDGAPWFSRDEKLVADLAARIEILQTQGQEAADQARRAGGPVGLRLFTAESPAVSEPALSEAEQAKLARQRAEMRRRLAATSHQDRVAGYAAELRTQRAYLGFDVSGRLPELTMPVLAIHGSDDRVFPDPGWERYAESQPNLSYLSIEGGSHGCGQSPEAVQAMIDFLESSAR